MKFSLNKMHIFGLLHVLLLLVTGYLLLRSANSPLETLFTLFFFLTFGIFTYISYEDLKSMEIPAIPTWTTLILLLTFNVFLIFTSGRGYVEILHLNYSPFNNLLTAAAASSFIGFIVLYSKGKAMGEGDILIAGIMGLLLGTKVLVAFFVTIMVATLFGLGYSAYLKRLKDVRVPFIPFMFLGTWVAFFFSAELIDWYFGLSDLILKLIY